VTQRCVFRQRLKVLSVSDPVMLDGKVFQMCGATFSDLEWPVIQISREGISTLNISETVQWSTDRNLHTMLDGVTLNELVWLSKFSNAGFVTEVLLYNNDYADWCFRIYVCFHLNLCVSAIMVLHNSTVCPQKNKANYFLA